MQAIVFDLYNTLVKITKRSYVFKNIYKEISSELDLSFQEYKKVLMSHPFEKITNILPIEFSHSFAKREEALRTEIDSVIIFPEVHQVLTGLQPKYRLFLISNLATPYKQPYYKLGLDSYFEDVIFSCDVGLMKPDSGIFQLLEDRYHLVKSETLMVGDSFKADFLGARNMGWNRLRVNRNQSKLKKLEISSLLEVLKY